MKIRPANITLIFAFALLLVTLFAISASGQTTPTKTTGPDKETVAAQGARLGVPIAEIKTAGADNKVPIAETKTVSADSKVPAAEPKGVVADNKNPATDAKASADDPKPADLQSELAAVKAENAAVREMLRKMAEQQKLLLEQVDRMQKRLDNTTTASVVTPATIIVPPDSPFNAAPLANGSAPLPDRAVPDTSVAAMSAAARTKQGIMERYQDGLVIWKTPDEDKVPFLLRLNGVTQFRYLNTLNSDETYTDHLGVEREVQKRNDVTVNRTMFLLNGYIYSKKLQYSFLVWTAAGAASIIIAGSIGWQFNKHLTLTAGYLGIPGSRSLTNTFPYFSSTDRTMADNFFRPGFTQGIMAAGEIRKGLYYNAFLGNSLNTLSISFNKIDTNLMGSGCVWLEPLGAYCEPGRVVNMYDDYFAQKKLRIRLGTSYTISKEDRFSNLDTSSPENTGVYNSDGVNAFQTGAFAIGVTVQNATYRMWATDWGLKYNGLAINGQYYLRTLNNFKADGPLPLTSTFDHGFELSVAKFVIPKKLMVYGRSSAVFGEFKSPYEFGAGVKWHFLATERLWMNAELMKIIGGSPYNGAFSPYNSGINGWVPMIQTVLSF